MIKKLFSLLILLGCFAQTAFSITIDEMTTPKPPAERLGTGHTPEKAYKVVESSKKEIKTKDAAYKENTGAKDLTYADLSLKKNRKRSCR